MTFLKKLKKCKLWSSQHARLLWASALLPMSLMLVVWLFMGSFPFGEKSFMSVDFGQQYIGLYGFLRHTFLSGDWSGFFYSFSKTIGGPMLGVWGFNLISPFNIFYIIFPLTQFKWAIFFSIWLRYGATGASMGYLLIKRYHPKMSTPLFVPLMATAYALSGMIVAYQSNPIFYDAMIALPLVIVGLEELLDGKKPTRYMIFLSMTLFLHFYMGYMICLFVILYSCYYLVWHSSKEENWQSQLKKVATGLVKTAAYSMVAVGMVFFLLYPIFISLLASKGSYNSGMAFAWQFQINPLDILSKLMIGGFDSESSWAYGPNLPNIFVGSLALVGFVLFFFLAEAPRRQKMAAFGVTLVFFFSITHEFTSKIWHMGQNPAGFFYRFSWIVSFFMVLLAYQTLQSYKKLEDKGLIASIVVVLTAVFYVHQHSSEYTYLTLFQSYGLTSFVTDHSVILLVLFYALVGFGCYFFLYRPNQADDRTLSYIGAILLGTAIVFYLLLKGYLFSQIILTLICLSAAVFYFYIRPKKKWVLYVILALVSSEMGYNAYLTQNSMPYDNATRFTNATETMEKWIQRIKEDSPNDFYRIATTIRYSYNDPFLLSYKGLSTFSSNLEESTLQLFGYMGSVGGNASTFYGNGTPLTDAIYGIRYFIEMKEYTQEFVEAHPDWHIFGRLATRPDLENKYDSFYDDDRFIFYKNENAYSVAFGVPKKVGDIQWTAHQAPDNLNKLVTAFNDEPKVYYNLSQLKNAELVNMELIEEEGKTVYRRVDTSQEGKIIFHFTPETDDTYYLYLPTTFRSLRDKVNFILNNEYYHYTNNFDQAQLWGLLDNKKGEEQQLVLKTSTEAELDLTNVRLVKADDAGVDRAVQKQKSQQMVVETWTNTNIRGHVTINDNDQMMLTSIPYDKGWSVKIDGRPVQTKKALTGLLTFPITEGKHQIQLTFIPKGWRTGLTVSGVSFLLFALIVKWDKVSHRIALYQKIGRRKDSKKK